MDKDTDSAKDVPVTATSVTSSPSTPTTSAATDVSARRSCPHCGRRMSSLQFYKHTVCVVCRDVKCSLDTRCKECKAWSKEFMLGYQRSLVSNRSARLIYDTPLFPWFLPHHIFLSYIGSLSRQELNSRFVYWLLRL